MNVWVLIAAVAVVTALLKAAGPVLLGGRDLPPRFSNVVTLLAAPLMAALVVTSALADGRHLEVDSASVGVALAGVLLWFHRPVVLAVAVAVVSTALLRLAGLP